MKIAIIGFGKMGRLTDRMAAELNHEVIYRISSSNIETIDDITGVDVAIEFTAPSAAISNFEKLLSRGIPTVTGTTGWDHGLDTVQAIVQRTGTPFFYASNFSPGVHITIAVSNYLAKLMRDFPEYSAYIEEWHHSAKVDAPSGTAISIGRELIKNYPEYKKIAPEEKKPANDELPIYSYREGNIPGTHKIIYNSDRDRISIKHTALNRDGFALGAIRAAEFIVGKPAGIYTMNHLIKLPV